MLLINDLKVRNKTQAMYYGPDTIVFQDGNFCKISEVDPLLFAQTLHYGFGVFEGLRSYETVDGPRIFKATTHFSRLLNSAEVLKLSLPFSPIELKALAYQLLNLNQLTDAYIRPLVYAGENMSLTSSGETHIMMMAWKWGRLLGDNQVNLLIAPNPRYQYSKNLMEAKVCGHYVNSIMATTEARAQGFHDALLLDVDGNIAQAPGANIFVEINEVLYTPPIGNIMPGITRKIVIDMARQLKIRVVEKHLIPADLPKADGAFLVGTATEIAPVASVNRVGFKLQWQDTLGYIISRKYRQLVTNKDTYQGTLI